MTPKVFIMSHSSSPPHSFKWNLHLNVPNHFKYVMFKINIFFPPQNSSLSLAPIYVTSFSQPDTLESLKSLKTFLSSITF